MDNVQGAARLARQFQRAPDGVKLGVDWPRVEEIAHGGFSAQLRFGGKVARDSLALGMHRDELAQSRRAFHPLAQRVVIHAGKILNAAAGHERLEANRTALAEFLQLVQIVRHESAPEGEVRQRPVLRDRKFLVEALAVNRRRMGIERHVEEHRPAPRRQRARAGFDSLPIRAARIVEVDVRINQAGENVEPLRVNDLARRTLERCLQRDDSSIRDANVQDALGHWQDDRASADDEVKSAQVDLAREWRKSFITAIATDTSSAVADSSG